MTHIQMEFTKEHFNEVLANESLLNTPVNFNLFTSGKGNWYKVFVFAILTQSWTYREWYDIQLSFSDEEISALNVLNTQLRVVKLNTLHAKVKRFITWLHFQGLTIDYDLFMVIFKSRIL